MHSVSRMADRFCEICGAKSSPHIPRQRLGNALVCTPCALNHGKATMPHPATARRVAHLVQLHARGMTPDEIVRHELGNMVRRLPDGRVAVAVRPITGPIHRVAHDSGDGETIFHCPFCGSGQVIARNDGTTECEFCSTAFTVQVQPQMPAFPQTIDGVPVDVPGMPNGGQSANVPPGGADAPPGAAGDDPDANPFGGDDAGADGDDSDDDSDGGDDKPAFLKGSARLFRTAAGKQLTYEQFMRHLALIHAQNPDEVLAQIRHENGVL